MPLFLDVIGFKNLDPETAERLEQIAAETVINNVMHRISELASQPVATEAHRLWEAGKTEELERYLAAQDMNFAELVNDETNRFIDLLSKSGQIIRGEYE